MRTRPVCAACLAALLAAAAGAADKSLAADLKRLDGFWEVSSAFLDGETVPAAKRAAMSLVVRGNGYEKRADGRAGEKGRVAFSDRRGTILCIDFTPADGPDKGKVFRGLFEWVGDDAIRLCTALRPGSRPVRPSGEKGTGQALVLYKRSKE